MITVTPTLATMADIYQLPATGGPTSPRFVAYCDAAASGAPISGYNPMTSLPALATVYALLALDAEPKCEQVANRVANWIGFDTDTALHLTVASPGAWTDRLATEVERRLLARDPSSVLWWTGEPVSLSRLETEVAAQTVRLAIVSTSGLPRTLRDAVQQEGRALAAGGISGQSEAIAAILLATFGNDEGLHLMVAYLYGDDAAVTHIPTRRRRPPFVAEMLGELLIQRRLENRLGQLLQQPVRARQRQALLFRLADQLSSRLQLSRLRRQLLLLGHGLQCRGHHRCLQPTSRQTCQAGHTVKSTVPQPRTLRSRRLHKPSDSPGSSGRGMHDDR